MPKVRRIALFSIVACVVCALSPAFAAVTVPNVIGDHMLIQRDLRAPIWGKADPGEAVTVTIDGRAVSAKADAQGRWRVLLPALKVGEPRTLTIAGASNTLSFSDILVGEVWVCSGQSNMQMTVNSSADADREKASANYPNIRLFQVKRVTSETPKDNCDGAWTACSPASVGDFSAAAYFFGRKLHTALDVPIGLIESDWGGTASEAWASMPTMEAAPVFKPILDRWNDLMAKYPAAQKAYETQLADWQKATDQAKAAGQEAPKKPGAPPAPGDPNRPANLYNGMIAPIVPYGMRGAIWYQGESNAGRAYQYREIFPAMIQDWRASWGGRPFPFYFVQIANWMARKPDPGDSAWAELREAQVMTLSLKNTGMAVIIDIGEEVDIHPKNKQDVGLRLALNALAKTYKQKIEYSGPMYKSLKVKGDRAILSFTHADGLTARDGGELKGFSIAGADKKFVWAKAEIQGQTIIVHADGVTAPAAVRYAWADNPECNLVNATGLPASPFRTDQWPGLTKDAK